MTMSPSAIEQLMTKAMLSDPDPLYHALREESSVRYTSVPAGRVTGVEAGLRSRGFLRYADVHSALRDHTTFPSHSPMAGQFGP